MRQLFPQVLLQIAGSVIFSQTYAELSDRDGTWKNWLFPVIGTRGLGTSVTSTEEVSA
jgi:hypothetical protein